VKNQPAGDQAAAGSGSTKAPIADHYDRAIRRFVAEVVFAVELEDLAEGGRRLRELANAASELGFTMQRGQVRADDAPEPSPDG
jgi:hypothetical protein